MTDLHEVIRAYILEEFLPGEDASELSDTTPLVSSGVLDSLATINLVAFLEERFGISVAPHEADVEYLDTVDAMARLVQGKLDAAGRG